MFTIRRSGRSIRCLEDDLNEELADIAIYLMGLSEMLGFELADEIEKKVSKNEKRVYKNIDGVNVRISD